MAHKRAGRFCKVGSFRAQKHPWTTVRSRADMLQMGVKTASEQTKTEKYFGILRAKTREGRTITAEFDAAVNAKATELSKGNETLKVDQQYANLCETINFVIATVLPDKKKGKRTRTNHIVVRHSLNPFYADGS